MGRQAPGGGGDDHERALRAVVRRVADDHPWAAPVDVDALIRDSFGATDAGEAHEFRLLVAERDARARLRREAPTEPARRHDPTVPMATMVQPRE